MKFNVFIMVLLIILGCGSQGWASPYPIPPDISEELAIQKSEVDSDQVVAIIEYSAIIYAEYQADHSPNFRAFKAKNSPIASKPRYKRTIIHKGNRARENLSHQKPRQVNKDLKIFKNCKSSSWHKSYRIQG